MKEECKRNLEYLKEKLKIYSKKGFLTNKNKKLKYL